MLTIVIPKALAIVLLGALAVPFAAGFAGLVIARRRAGLSIWSGQ